MTKTMSATVIGRKYSNGVNFYTVECKPCLVVLNSGHHYRHGDLKHALALRDQHNHDEHNPTETIVHDCGNTAVCYC